MQTRRLVFPALMLAAAAAYAAPVTYTFTGTATGTIASTPFTNATLTITVAGDTSSIVPGSGFISFPSPAGATTFSVSGIGAGTFTNATAVNANPAFNGAVNFSENSLLITMEDTMLPQNTLASYTLATSIGPVGPQATNPSVGDWVNIPTSRGAMTVTAETNVVFQAVVTGVPTTPAPPSFYLLLTALLGLAGFLFSRRRALR